MSRHSVLVLVLLGCSSGGPELPLVDRGGKADDYYSNVAAEFEASGSIPVEMTPEEFADEAVRRDKAARRVSAVGLYLTVYMSDKFRGIDIDGDGEIEASEVFFTNVDYGGFHAMVRNRSVEVSAVEGEAGQYQVSFTIDLAGPPTLLDALPRSPAAPEGEFAFDLRMPKGATADPEHVSGGAIRSFDPDQYTGDLETVVLRTRRLPDAANAWPAFKEMIADGVLDITIVYGHDYNAERQDLPQARAGFDELSRAGFTLPVARFSDLVHDSGPAVKRVRAAGRELRMEVRLFHSDMFKDDRPGQKALVLEELTTRDVFIYAGHAGPYYGFYLDEAHAAQIEPAELTAAPFTDRQQLVMAKGCQTYSQYADVLYANPVKSEANLDVVTTVNFSYSAGTLTLLRYLTDTENGHHKPWSYYRLMWELNNEPTNSQYMVFFGVTGIEDGPRVHPYADLDAIGSTCAIDGDCGDPHGNICVSLGDEQQCAARALGERDCPEGSRFSRLVQGTTIVGHACVPN